MTRSIGDYSLLHQVWHSAYASENCYKSMAAKLLGHLGVGANNIRYYGTVSSFQDGASAVSRACPFPPPSHLVRVSEGLPQMKASQSRYRETNM